MVDLWRRKLSFRRLTILVIRLLNMPGESSLAEAQFGERARWGYREHLLADVIDQLKVSNWLTVQVNKAEGFENPYPDPHPRPGETRASIPSNEQDFASPEEVATLFARLATG
ncbi:hypothetical protein ACFWY5_29865 [Nonomuraea sp. NPDC059007]|uniref:hypothetical protein n=1 Tax=Nonomuraea sp. NPDC059007 TaxID=3346692 RepID=UPI003694BB2F